MIYIFFAIWILIAAATFIARSRRTVHIMCGLYLATHLAFAIKLLALGGYLTTSGEFFTFDQAGTLFYILLAVVSTYVIVHSVEYLKDDKIENYRVYFSLLLLLITAITGVYFANNIAITWILLETTTLCGAGILYHRH